MKLVTATVVYPVSVQVEVPEDATEDQIEEAVLNQADAFIESSTVKPVIHECEELGI